MGAGGEATGGGPPVAGGSNMFPWTTGMTKSGGGVGR